MFRSIPPKTLLSKLFTVLEMPSKHIVFIWVFLSMLGKCEESEDIGHDAMSTNGNAGLTNISCAKFDKDHSIPMAYIDSHVFYQITICTVVLIAAVSKLVFHQTPFLSKHVPESCLLIVLGSILGAIINEIGPHVEPFKPHEFFNYLLPPIILEAAYSLHDRVFFNNLGSILIFAVIGTVLTWLAIGYSLYGVSLLGAMGEIDITTIQILLFSALISAVDPVAVLAVFHEIGVNPVLYFLVFGESLLNDGVTVVLYKVLQEMNKMTHIANMQIFMAVLKFFVVVCGGLLVGIVFGCATAIMTRFTRHVRVVEPIAVYAFAYMSHLIAELFGFSGIISVIACGLVQVQYSFDNVTPKSNTTIKYFSKVMSGTCEIVIFLYLGLALVTHKHHWHTGLTLWTIVFTLIYRFIITYALSYAINRFDDYRTRKITLEEQFIMSYGGLRGAVCFSLVTLLDQKCLAERDMLITTSLAVIIFTVVVQGSTIQPLVKLLKISLEPSDKPTMCVVLNDKVTDHLMAGIEGIVGFNGKFRLKEKLEFYDDKYLKRFLQRDPLKADVDIKVLYEKIALREHWENLYACNVKLPDHVVASQQSLQSIDHIDTSSTVELDSLYKSRETIALMGTASREGKSKPFITGYKDLQSFLDGVGNQNAKSHIDKNLVHEDATDDFLEKLHKRRCSIKRLHLSTHHDKSRAKKLWSFAAQELNPSGKLLNVVLRAHEKEAGLKEGNEYQDMEDERAGMLGVGGDRDVEVIELSEVDAAGQSAGKRQNKSAAKMDSSSALVSEGREEHDAVVHF